MERRHRGGGALIWLRVRAWDAEGDALVVEDVVTSKERTLRVGAAKEVREGRDVAALVRTLSLDGEDAVLRALAAAWGDLDDDPGEWSVTVHGDEADFLRLARWMADRDEEVAEVLGRWAAHPAFDYAAGWASDLLEQTGSVEDALEAATRDRP